MIARALLPFVLASLAAACAGTPPEPRADLLIVGGRVYTVEPDRPWAEAVAVRGDRIVRVGTEKQVRALAGPSTRVYDASGGVVLPGFNDGHSHFLDGSLGIDQVDLTGAVTLADIQEKVRRYAADRPDEPWIIGFGWLYSTFPGGFPDRKDLDSVESGRPVLLWSYDGHSGWCNSAALEAAGITAATPQLPPSQGEIVKDRKTGQPTGALKEGAMGLIERVLPKPSHDRKIAALQKGMKLANSFGITSVQNCSGGQDEIDLYAELQKDGRLTVRTSTAFPMPDSPVGLTDSLIAHIEAARQAHHDHLVRAGTVKFFADGVIESNTAAMLAPYSNNPAVKGTPHYDARQLQAMVRRVDAAGFQIYIHAIGDGAVRMSLDALEAAARERPGQRRRHRLEHIETIDARDIARFGSLGVLASMQPYHAYPETNLLEVWAKNIGPERLPEAFDWNSIAKSGGRLVYGSDWPVVTMDVLIGLHNAVLRQDTDGKPEGGWMPAERVTLEQAVAAYTINGAYSSFEEDVKGSIKEGKLADLVVVKPDIFTAAPLEIHKAKVAVTIFDGREVYRKDVE